MLSRCKKPSFKVLIKGCMWISREGDLMNSLITRRLGEQGDFGSVGFLGVREG